MENRYAYIRVSSRDQNEDRQRIAMRDYGITDVNIVLDKQSGKDFSRPGYISLLEKLEPCDTLVIKSIDRLGKNYSEILEQWRILTKEKQISIIVLDMLLNTEQNKDLTGTLIADIVLQLLSYVAENERTFIRQRQQEGIAAAKARGVKFGRPPKQRSHEFEELKEKWLNGEISARKASKKLGINHTTFQKWSME